MKKENATKKKKQDIVYEQLGFNTDVPEPELEQLHIDERNNEQAIQEAQEETGVVLKNVATKKLKNGTPVEITNKVAFEESKVSLGRLPIWYLNALGSMTKNELEDFEAEYADDMSANEIIALNLIKGAMRGENRDTDRFWNIQQRLLNKTNVVNQINLQVQKPDAVVTELLDNITKKIKEADVD